MGRSRINSKDMGRRKTATKASKGLEADAGYHKVSITLTSAQFLAQFEHKIRGDKESIDV